MIEQNGSGWTPDAAFRRDDIEPGGAVEVAR